MIQDQPTTSWDISQTTHAPPITSKLYILYLLVTCVVVAVKLAGAWNQAARLRASEQQLRTVRIQRILAQITSLKRWMWLTVLGCALCLSVDIVSDLNRFLTYHSDLEHPSSALFLLSDYFAVFTMALFVITFVYLVRWHLSFLVKRAR
jgi:hypothetical protein